MLGEGNQFKQLSPIKKVHNQLQVVKAKSVGDNS